MHMDCPTRPKQGDNPVHEATIGIVENDTVSLDVPASPETVCVFVVVVPSEVMTVVTEFEDEDDPEDDDDDDDESVEPEDVDPEEEVPELP